MMVSDNEFWFHILLLKITTVWPISLEIFQYLLCLITSYSGFTASVGFIYQIMRKIEDTNAFIEYMIAVVDYSGYMYVRWCFRSRIPDIAALMDVRKIFGKFCPKEEIVKTDKSVLKLGKVFFLYGLMGNLTNNMLALYDRAGCTEKRSEVQKRRDPCGMIARCYYLYDIDQYPLFHVAYVTQVIGCFIISFAILMCTMTQIGITQHAIAQLVYCRKLIRHFQMDGEPNVVRKQINNIIEYHVTIIQYSEKVNNAFSKMLLLHLTLTSLVISILGFELLLTDNFADLSRFLLHLLGWILLLALTCYYGQQLIDESLGLCEDMYFVPWYLASPAIQKDVQLVILRSQRKLKLTCAGLGEVSLETFLVVMKSAYSYLTLLLKFKG